ncbi:hypothetical protein QJQ45_021346, partial [Haematococcus lacustris]
PKPSRWLDQNSSTALNMQHSGESVDRPLELCLWPDWSPLCCSGTKKCEAGSKPLSDRLYKVQEREQRAWEVQRQAAASSLRARAQHSPPAKRSKRIKAEPPAEPTKGIGKGKAAKAKPMPQPGRWLDRDCNAALNMQRIGESRWCPLELCWWPEQGALPAKGKEYPGLGYKRLRDKPPKAQQQQQPAEAHMLHTAATLQTSLIELRPHECGSGEQEQADKPGEIEVGAADPPAHKAHTVTAATASASSSAPGAHSNQHRDPPSFVTLELVSAGADSPRRREESGGGFVAPLASPRGRYLNTQGSTRAAAAAAAMRRGPSPASSSKPSSAAARRALAQPHKPAASFRATLLSAPQGKHAPGVVRACVTDYYRCVITPYLLLLLLLIIGASGSGQQVQGQGQAVKVVIAERRQVIKAALRGLVEAAQPDLSPAEVDAVVAEVNKRMTMGSKQCVLAAVMSLTVLLQSFLGQPTPGFPAAAGPAPGPPPPPDPAHPPYAHPRIPTRSSPRTAAAPAQLPPPVQLGIWDPQLLAQIRDAMELLTKASVIEHMMRGPHHHGIRLLPGEVAAFEQPSSAWPVAMLQLLDEEHLTGDGNSLNANATNIITSIQEFYRHPGRFIRWWCKAVGVVEEGFSGAMKKHFPQLVLGRLDYSLPDRQHKWRLPANSMLRQPRWKEEVAKHRRLLGLPATWREGQDSIGKGGAGRLPLEKRVRYVLFVNRSLEGWQAAHDTCPRPFTMLPMVGAPPPAPAQDPPAPAPAQAPPAQAPPPAPPAQAQPLPAAPGPAPPPQAPPGGRWLDRDTNACLNFQRIGESMQRPLELCSWDDLEALPPIGKEYQQRYKRVNDRLPKGRQWLHRAAEYRRGIDGTKECEAGSKPLSDRLYKVQEREQRVWEVQRQAAGDMMDALKGRFVIPADDVRDILARGGYTTEKQLHAFLMSLVEPASELARPPISKYNVGAVGLGVSGAIYMGVNIEFPNSHLNNSDTMRFVFGAGSHWLHQHPGAHDTPTPSTPPPGPTPLHSSHPHSLNPTATPSQPHTLSDLAPAPAPAPRRQRAYSLDELLPSRFGPMDLALDGQPFPLLLQPQPSRVELSNEGKDLVLQRCQPAPHPSRETGSQGCTASTTQGKGDAQAASASAPGTGTPGTGAGPAVALKGVAEAEQAELAGGVGEQEVDFAAVAAAAVHWANQSYSPYTKSPSAVVIVSVTGKLYGGAFMESAAYNPSLTPFHCAWVAAVVDHIPGWHQIREVVLAELADAPVQHLAGVRALLQAVAPAAKVTPLLLARHENALL